MFDFWYSERCTRGIKLAICIATCAIIYFLSNLQKLAPIFAISCLGIGIMTHLIWKALHRIKADHPHRKGVKVLGTICPLTALILVILLLPNTQKTLLALQAIAFSALGLFIVSIYQNRAPR